MAYMAWSMDSSLLGMRVSDVMRSVDYALSRPELDRSRLVVIGSGMGALWGLYAAVLDPRIPFLIANGGLLSYKVLVQSDRYKVGANIMVPGVLKQLDLPQAAAALADRRLVLISPTGPMKTPVPLDDVRQAYRFAGNAYENLGVKEQFQIVTNDPVLGPAAQYHALLNEPIRG
jgi:pimeloyl-ACP methyl ester carboxylesterase